MEKPIAAIVTRVSTGQKEDGTSLETQLVSCEAEAEHLGYQVHPDYVFREVRTGADIDRPGLSEVRRAIAARAFAAVIVHSPDRLSRDPLDTLLFARELQEAGSAAAFCPRPSDDSPEGRLLMYIEGYVGQREHQQIAERSMRAKDALARSGRLPNGTGSGLYGTDYDPLLKIRIINEVEAAVVRLIFQWASEGVSCYEIARRLNESAIPTRRGKLWHPLGVKRTLTNRAYTGVQFYGEKRWTLVKGVNKDGQAFRRQIATDCSESEWVRIEGFTPQIISPPLFAQVQERLSTRQAMVRKPKMRYLLTGFVRCGKCGAPICGASLQRKHRCYRWRATNVSAKAPATCRELYIRTDALELLVWCKLLATIKDPTVLIADLQHHL